MMILNMTTAGGSGSGANVGTATASASNASYIDFTGLFGTPVAFFARNASRLSPATSNVVVDVAGSGASGSWSLSGSTVYQGILNVASPTLSVATGSASIRLTAQNAYFNGNYELTYVYE